MSRIVEKEIGNLIEYKPINYDNIPTVSDEEYRMRVNSLLELAQLKSLTHIIVYADREHFSNIEYLTKYDPRFEEALLILSKDNIPTIVVGNEGFSYSDIIPYEINRELYQSFSLMGQPRGKSKKLKDIFSSAGINRNSKIGIIGWKKYYESDFPDYEHCIEIPCFIVEVLSELVDRKNIVNANDLMMDNEYGLRHKLSATELILHEVAGTKTSQKVLNVIRNLREGISEIEASEYLCIDGDPIATHPNINFGSTHVIYGLASPTYHKKLSYGELISVGLGYRRALTHRIGIFARDKSDISSSLGDIVEYLYKPYFEAIAAWYEAVRIGVTGGEVYSTLEKILGSFEKYGIALNPGHQIHTDEWTNSLFFKDSKYKIASGMAIQCDIIAMMSDVKAGAHIEDGIVIADSNLRKEIQALAPECWDRIVARRKFMKEVLGINLSEDVLPTSDLAGIHFPYMANTRIVLARDD